MKSILVFLIFSICTLASANENVNSGQNENTVMISNSEKAQSVLTEKEIPLKLQQKSASAEGSSPWVRMGLGLLVLGGIVAAFSLQTYRNRKKMGVSSKQIQVLSQHWLGPKKNLTLIRVAGETLLIGVTDNSINHLKTLSLMDDEVPADTPKKFSDVLPESALGNKAALNQSQNKNEDIESEEFQMTGVHQIKKSVLQKLREMRTIN